ncbi:hypothetical protein [Myxococcus sp. CA040A]|uniref:hypothetical protein n=1 Tax=Myxococcus sp. CA040A TaxID=2741738 RepID=UPI00157AF1F1|nr:hypothetical protein [Myxococcus sp. CA040A]NTX08304.1 hypothetical protein [Myxococcus sp. CA040A]
MRASHWSVLLTVGLAGCGAPTRLELQGAGLTPLPENASVARTSESAREDSRHACPGAASRLKIVIPPGSGGSINGPFPESFVDVRGKLYFATNLFDGSATLWRSNGTEAGTVPVKSFPAAPVGVPPLRNLFPVGDLVFFQFDEPSTGRELWVSDGTETGTRLVKDLTPGPEGTYLAAVAAQHGQLTFLRLWSFAPGNPQVELWRSDGTASGTVRFANFGTSATLGNVSLRVGDNLLFFLASPEQGTALWRTDGTASGTQFVKKLDAQVVNLTTTGQAGAVGLFLFKDGANTEVWKTDGTASGTLRLDAFGKSVNLLGALHDTVYLSSVDSTTMLMRIESLSLQGGGKASVTTLPNPFAGQEAAYPYPQQMAVSGDLLYFSVAIASPGPPPRAATLWVSNGTAAGTLPLSEDLSLSDEYASPLFPTGDGAALFVASTTHTSLEPWFTQGTVATTRLLADIHPGPASSIPDGFARVGDRIYFRAVDDTGSYQPWFVSCPRR